MRKAARTTSDRKPTEFERKEALRLLRLRREARISQGWLAERLGISSQQWSKGERGENRIPLERFQTAERILLGALGRHDAATAGFGESPQAGYAAQNPATFGDIVEEIEAARQALDRVEKMVRSRLG